MRRVFSVFESTEWKRYFAVFILAAAVLPLWGGMGLALDADDFLPPVQASPEQKEALMSVKDEASVKTEVDPVLKTEVTTAPTLQDAINKIVEKPKQGCRLIQQRDGSTVFVATGNGSYNPDYQNVVASRIEQRNAYVEAFMNAKSEMTQTAGELVVRGATDFDKKVETIDSDVKSLTNIERELSEEQLQSARKVLKGYVTYSVQDDGKGRVYVTIVSSPKTRGKYGRSGADGITAASLSDGLNMLIAEIKSGLVPPVGGRVIEVPGSGEVAFVGFGSSVVRKDSEPDVQEELNLQAEQVAGLRAADALAGIILGDDTSWQAHADETTRKQVKDFETLQMNDQTAKGSDAEIREYENRIKGMRNTLSTDTKIQSLRNGVLPPGIIRETSLDDDEYFAYGIAVYVPSVTDAARQASQEMDDAQIVRPPAPAASPSDTARTGGGKQSQDLEMKKGPSGIVEQDL
ncbi:MAG: hypothetical protein LBR87_04895 [Synergistaceae bacterium]|jgi:hypothetical protein|nr:hypothetical protein [Synergistaceae bacterium]